MLAKHTNSSTLSLFVRAAALCVLSLPGLSVAEPAYELTPQSRAILTKWGDHERAKFSRGDSSVLGKYLSITRKTAQEAVDVYSQNEVAGDKMFFRKATLLTGSIASINSGLGNAPYLVFKTKSFAGAQAHMAKDLVDRVATLKKGQKISVYCEGAGSVAGVPIFKNCKFSDDIAQTEWARFEQDIVNHYNGVPNPPLPVGPVAVMLAAHTPALPPKLAVNPMTGAGRLLRRRLLPKRAKSERMPSEKSSELSEWS